MSIVGETNNQDGVVLSWQQRVFLGSLIPTTQQNDHSTTTTDDSSSSLFHSTTTTTTATTTDDAWFNLLLHDDNTSSAARCAANTFVCECDEHQSSAVMVVLQWTKLLFLKVARMYSVAPICLALLPLFIGFLLGFWIASTTRATTNKKSSSQGWWFSTTTTTTAYFYSSACISTLTTYFWSILLYFPKMAFWISYQRTFGKDVLTKKEQQTRATLRSKHETLQESNNVSSSSSLGTDDTSNNNNNNNNIPQHIAVIMDGNRRYGRMKYNNATQGHWDGSQTLLHFAKWCMAEHIPYLTVYAFSTENWNRHPSEVASLMALFLSYCDELRQQALEHNIQIRVLSTDTTRIPQDVKRALQRMVEETKHCFVAANDDDATKTIKPGHGLILNICLSYGSRGEIIGACKSIVQDVQAGQLQLNDITEDAFSKRLLLSSSSCPDPDIIIRTSGEYRISNFLLWQLAYSELFFIDKTWPELTKSDLLHVLRTYANGRNRRFGK